MEEDEFLLRVSDGAKFEDITVIAKMVWEEEVPKINVPKEIKITEGEAFFYEVTVGSKNNLELFVHSLANAPEWVTLNN